MAALLRMASQGFRCALKHLSFSMVWVACLLLYGEGERNCVLATQCARLLQQRTKTWEVGRLRKVQENLLLLKMKGHRFLGFSSQSCDWHWRDVALDVFKFRDGDLFM